MSLSAPFWPMAYAGRPFGGEAFCQVWVVNGYGLGIHVYRKPDEEFRRPWLQATGEGASKRNPLQKGRKTNMIRHYFCLVAMAAWAGSAAGALAAGDAAEGEKIFTQKCKVCHQIGEGAKNFIGPLLNGVVGRKSGTAPDFNYSEVMKSSGLTWDEATLNEYLTNPKAKVPGTKMIFAGLPKESDRENLIAYLSQIGPDGKKK